MTNAPVRAAIYCRISRDKEGAGLGVDRQEADCRALADRLGWDVVALFVDNDISAYSGKPRPEYRAMLGGIKEGVFTGVLAWHTDRLHRRATELEEFVALAEAHQLQVQTVTAGTLDLSSASGRMVARMLGAAAQHEVDHARERMKAKRVQMAEQGAYRGGPRPYGYEKDGVTVRPEEARVVREATAAILAGRTLAAVARELNDRGIPTSTGNRWTYMRLRDVLTRPRNAGLLHRGRHDRPHTVPFEIVGPGCWPAIVDEDTWRAVHSLLIDPARRTQDGNEPRWLGSGIYVCGLCGTTLRAAPHGATASNRRRTRKYHYRCTGSAHLTVAAQQTDEYVRQVVVDLIRDPRVVAAIVPADGGDDVAADREQRTVLAARLVSFEDDYTAGLINGHQFRKMTDRVTAELERVDARLSERMRRSAMSPVLAALDPGQAFLDSPLDVQRGILTAVLPSVRVLPQAVRGAAWSAQRIRLTPVVA